jgi:hypothetical protein
MPDDRKPSTDSGPDQGTGLAIAPPRADRQPLHANLFSVMQRANTKLTPLFPYMHPGAIVPTGALFIGGPGTDYGQFFHHNSVDEIIIAFVARDANLATGQLYNGGRVHGVNSFLKDQTKAGSFALFTITQRQLDSGPQPESIELVCTACRKRLFIEHWDSATAPDARELDTPMPSVTGPALIMPRFNADPELRKCKECGHQNDPFPNDRWGWVNYWSQSVALAEGQKVLAEAGASIHQAGATAGGR